MPTGVGMLVVRQAGLPIDQFLALCSSQRRSTLRLQYRLAPCAFLPLLKLNSSRLSLRGLDVDISKSALLLMLTVS